MAPIESKLVSPPIKQSLSFLSIPVEIDMKNYLKMAEEALPTKFVGEEKQCEGLSFAYVFIRDPIEFEFKNTSIDYEVDGKFELKLNYCPKCLELWNKKGSCVIPRIYLSCGCDGESMRRVKVAYSTKIGLSENYVFEASTSLKKFDVLDPCKLSLLKYNATPELEKQVRKQLLVLEDDIDKQIKSIDVKNSINDAWNKLQEPIPVSELGFLYLQPNSIGLNKLEFNNNKAFLNLNLSIFPFFSTQAENQKKSPLPLLKSFDNENGLNLTIDIKASYDSLSSYLNRQLKGKELNFKGKKINIQQLVISGAQDQKLILKMAFDGYKKGVVFLSGIPVLDSFSQKISITNLDFDVHTKSVLIKLAKWMFNEKILLELEQNTVFELSPILEEAKENILKSINLEIAPGVRVSGNIDSFVFKELYLDSRQFLIRTKFFGTMKLKVD